MTTNLEMGIRGTIVAEADGRRRICTADMSKVELVVVVIGKGDSHGLGPLGVDIAAAQRGRRGHAGVQGTAGRRNKAIWEKRAEDVAGLWLGGAGNLGGCGGCEEGNGLVVHDDL